MTKMLSTVLLPILLSTVALAQPTILNNVWWGLETLLQSE